MTPAEQIARIIDPATWDSRDSYVSIMTESGGCHPDTIASIAERRVAPSLAKAEQAIAIVREEAATVEQSTDPWSAGLEDADGNDLITVLASNYDALLSAVRAAQALATACMAPGCYSHEEIEDIARATKPTFDAALDRKLGSAS